MRITRGTTTKEIVTTEEVPDGFDIRLTDDEALVIRFILASVYLERDQFTSGRTGVQRFVDIANELEVRMSNALSSAGVKHTLSPFVLEPRKSTR